MKIENTTKEWLMYNVYVKSLLAESFKNVFIYRNSNQLKNVKRLEILFVTSWNTVAWFGDPTILTYLDRWDK